MLAEVKNVKEVKKKITEYDEIFNETDYQKRSENSQKATDKFYDLITEFYERGWGQSFHFAPRFKGEDFHSSIIRHEHFLATRLGLSANDIVLDVGCGVMGPARNIARVSGAHITGLTINHHQVGRCMQLNSQSTVGHLLDVKQGDFMNIPYPDNTFDKMYAIEALCHAPSVVDVYKQILNKLKPGGKACFYEWAMTDKYDASNPEHVKVKEMIEYGNGITKMNTIKEIDQAIIQAGFKKEETIDLVDANYGNDYLWYATLESGWSLSQIRHTKLSRTLMSYLLRILETVGIVKKGVVKTQRVLIIAADGLVLGGKLGIFTPMYMVVVSKPEN
ncbi:MAG: methyltransferase domain-containing protein [Chitinophagales bacterium]|jgi:sterol 24-C-methyltransferase|nr:methyltransferase domain-containing protein [Chitinophagales bacterium]